MAAEESSAGKPADSPNGGPGEDAKQPCPALREKLWWLRSGPAVQQREQTPFFDIRPLTLPTPLLHTLCHCPC